MKNILIVIILLFFSLDTRAQVDSVAPPKTDTSLHQKFSKLIKEGHFTFKGIPIDGALNPFVTQLKKQGFSVVSVTSSDAILKGKFTDQDVHILVQASYNKVYGVTVSYEKKDTWNAVKAEYERMKLMLVGKYGDPMEVIEEFESPYREGSGSELLALRKDKCTYMAQYASESGNGMIRLKISSDASIAIHYVDTMNYIFVSEKAADDL